MAINAGLRELAILAPVALDRDAASMTELELLLIECEGKLIF